MSNALARVAVERVGSLSALTFGCASVGGRVSKRESLRAMSEAYARGVTTFDVARSYGYGEAESILGSFLRDKRDAQIITKAGIRSPKPSRVFSFAKSVARRVFAVFPKARSVAKPSMGAQHQGGFFEPQMLAESLETSLRALRRDHVDVLLLHACDASVAAREDVRGQMERFVEQGLVRRVGVGSGAAEALAWIGQGGEPTAELAAAQTGDLFAAVQPAHGCWIANQPLGGGSALQEARVRLASLHLDPSLALEVLLHAPLDMGVHSVVLSMLSEDHVRRAADAMTQPTLQRAERLRLHATLKETT